jgi:hypothetical protein
MEPRVIELRVHTEASTSSNRKRQVAEQSPERWPAHALVLDCETTIDAAQALTFGSFQYCHRRTDHYVLVQEGLFYADGLDLAKLAVLQAYAARHRIRLHSRAHFMRRVWWPAIRAHALVVGFNLPFDLSRLACDGVWTPRRRGAWSFTLEQYRDRRTRRLRENTYFPRLVITPKDGKGAFFRLTDSRGPKKFPPIRCLDLKTLVWALESRSHSLASACKSRGVPGKLDDEPTGHVTVEEIDYNRQDVRATLNLLNSLRTEFDRHPIDLTPDRAYSPASIAKAYLAAMGLAPPRDRFRLPATLSGMAMQAYYGGRTECRIRHTVVPVVYTDFLSQYPTVHGLMGLQALLIAESIETVDATEDVRRVLATFTPAQGFTPDIWKQMAFFGLVQPAGDVLPVRTMYNDATSNIGVNPLTSDAPIWYAGPDLLAATLLTGRPPKILRAIRLVARGQQPGLRSVSLRNQIDVDPRTSDFFKTVIEARARVQASQAYVKQERKVLALFLKTLAASGAYGLFVELNPERVDRDPRTGAPKRAAIRVWAGDRSFPTTTDVVERPGVWFCPWLASLITAGGRLLLALLEHAVTDAGGTYLLCDTDSMAIVASKYGGLVLCRGGSHRVPDGSEAIRALSWKQVQGIVASFESLNPYAQRIVPESILKTEDVNYNAAGHQREIHGYAIASKRYALFHRNADGGAEIVKASGHGLGYLYAPVRGFDEDLNEPVWVIEAWDWIVRGVLTLPQTSPPWFALPAMMRIAITTPEVLRALQMRQRRLTYEARVKPFNFVIVPILDALGIPITLTRETFTLIAPFTKDASQWYDRPWVNLYDGKRYKLARPGQRRSYEAEATTYADVVGRYRWHPEAKSLGPEGLPCASDSAGLLRRTPVQTRAPFRSIGKETDRRWEREDDISLLTARVIEYQPNETSQLSTDTTLQHRARHHSIRVVAKTAGVSERTVKAVRRGERIRRSTARKLEAALTALEALDDSADGSQA